MGESDPQPNPAGQWPWLREGLILLGFLLIVAAALATVAIPELSDDTERPDGPEAATAADAGV